MVPHAAIVVVRMAMIATASVRTVGDDLMHAWSKHLLGSNPSNHCLENGELACWPMRPKSVNSRPLLIQ